MIFKDYNCSRCLKAKVGSGSMHRFRIYFLVKTPIELPKYFVARRLKRRSAEERCKQTQRENDRMSAFRFALEAIGLRKHRYKAARRHFYATKTIKTTFSRLHANYKRRVWPRAANGSFILPIRAASSHIRRRPAASEFCDDTREAPDNFRRAFD